jgi:hypothetical protein
MSIEDREAEETDLGLPTVIGSDGLGRRRHEAAAERSSIRFASLPRRLLGDEFRGRRGVGFVFMAWGFRPPPVRLDG